MIKKYKLRFIAIAAIIFVVIAFLALAFHSSLGDSGRESVWEGMTAGTPASIISTNGSVESGYQPENGAAPIANETQLYAFFDGTGEYVGVNSAYLSDNITITVPQALQSRVLAKGKTLDGNGKKITMNFTSSNYQTINASSAFEFSTNGVFKDHGGNTSAATNRVVTAGGLLAQNHGNIKNLSIQGNTNTVRVAVADGVVYPSLGSPVIGLNTGNILNFNVKLDGARFEFHKYYGEWNSNNSYKNTAILGGIAGMNVGVIDGARIENNVSTFICNARGKAATNNSTNTHTIIGGAVGKLLSDKADSAGTGNTTAIMKDIVMVGSGLIEATTHVDSTTKLVGSNNTLREIGGVVGSNTIVTSGKVVINDASGYAAGQIDGVLMGFQGQQYTSWSIDNLAGSSGREVVGGNPVLSCGDAANIIYVTQYNGRATQCDHKNDSTWHNKVSYSTIYTLDELPNGAEFSVTVDKAANELNSKRFNVIINIIMPESSDDVIFDIVNTAYEMNASDNDSSTIQKTEHIAGWSYFNEDGSTPFYDKNAPINSKHATVYHYESRPSRGWDSVYNRIELSLGKNATVEFGETIANKEYTGTDIPIVLKDSTGKVINANEKSSFISSNYKHPDADIMSVKSFFMPGDYTDIKILSSESDKYGCVDTLNKYVAPIKTPDGAPDVVSIAFPTITISNLPDPSMTYLEYTVNYSLSAGQGLLKNVYYSSPNNIWSPADSVASHRFFKTTNPQGTKYRLAGYGMFDPTATSITSVPTDNAVQLKVTTVSDEFNLIIDHEAPACVYTDEQGNTVFKPTQTEWSDNERTVYFKVNDEHSAIAAVTVTADGVAHNVNELGEGLYSFVISDNRTYLITAKDALGNTFNDELKLMIDVVEPSISVTGYNNGQTVESNINIIAGITASEQSSGRTVTLSVDDGEEQIIDISSGKFVFNINGTHKYLFKNTAGIKGAGGNYKYAEFVITVTLSKAIINVSDNDIVVADGEPIVMKYNGTNRLSTDEYAVVKTRIAWNSASQNYDELKNLDFDFYFKNSAAGTSSSTGNYLIIEPIDPSGTMEFIGEIRYTKSNITPAMVTVTIQNMQRAYGEVNPIFTYTLGGLIGSDTAEIFDRIPLKTVAFADSPAGHEYVIEIDMTLEQLNNTIFAGTGYRVNSATVVNGVLTITKRSLDNDFKYISVPTGADYTGKEIGIEAEYNFDGQWLPLPVTYYKADGTQLNGKPIDIGSYYGILMAPNSNFEFSNEQRVDFVISSAEIVIKFTNESGNAINYQYSGIPIPVAYTLSNEDYSNAILTYYDNEGFVVNEVPTEVGSYRVRVEYTPNVGSNFKKTIREVDYIIVKADFIQPNGSGVLFNNVTEAFNGQQHRLTLKNVPDGTSVEFVFTGDMQGVEINNEQGYFGAIQQRTYNVTAKLRNPNYNNLDIKAVLTIVPATMNVAFDNVQTVYDGNTHWVVVTGAPEGAAITFSVPDSYKDSLIVESNRVGGVDAGVYNIRVNIIAEGYNPVLKSAVLNITEATISGLSFTGLTVPYDNKPHRITVDGLPKNAGVVITVNNISYSQNYFEATNAGIYSATARISLVNHKSVTLQATLTINAASLEEFIDAPNIQFDYKDGENFYYEIGLTSDVDINVTCKELGITDSKDLRYKLPATGVYNFEITASKQNYITKTFSRRVTLNEAEFDLSLESVSGKYDGTDFTVKLNGIVPSGTTFEWNNPYENVTLLPNNAGFKSSQAGNYEVTVVISKANYRSITLTGKLFIASANMKNLITGARDTNFKWTEQGHTLTIGGIPKDAVVVMTCQSSDVVVDGNTLTVDKIGAYTVELSIEAPNYNNFYKKFNLAVIPATFDDVKCDNVTSVFDNTEKSIKLTGFPKGAVVSFMHDSEEILPNEFGEYVFTRTASGSYLVEYSVSMDNYDTKRGTAVLTINKAAFSITPKDYTAEYNGKEHVYDIVKELELPENTILQFISTGDLTPVDGVLKATDAGVHKIIIRLLLDNYIPTELQFYISITKLNFNEIIIDDINVDFNEKSHTMTVEGVPDGANLDISYISSVTKGIVVDGNKFSALHAGVYTVKITLSKANYNDYGKTVTMTINKAKVPVFTYSALEMQWKEGDGNYVVDVLDVDGAPVDTEIYYIKWNALGNTFTDAGSHDIAATVYRKGDFESDYEPYKIGNAKFVVKTAKIPAGAFIASYSGKYDGQPHTATVMNVQEGFNYSFITATSLTNAGLIEVKCVISKKNYEPLNISGYVSIDKVEVEVKYFVNPSYAEGFQPRVVGRYTDVNGNEINFLVDTSELEYGKAGNYTIKVDSVGDDNYTVSKETSSVDIVIGVIKQSSNIAAIAGGSAGGGVALVGGIAAAIVIIKKKVIKL